MEAASSATEARRFGKYTLVAKLATGGMAEIFLARLHGDGGFEKLVCIKRILPHLAKDPQLIAMFLDEARVAARISHPNVCQVFELGEWHGMYYIAMEYLEGVPLSVFRRKQLYPLLPDPRLVAGFGVQACEGLHHAHQLKRPDGELLGVVHRDISPQNLFATTDGIVKVLDFGIAKVQDASIRTSTGVVKGTYAYMAPEQLRNEALDRRVDVWAVGVVLWETLAQRQLFKRDTEFLTFEAITKLPIPGICEVRPDVPPLLGDVLARALARQPAERFSSARALGEALAQAVGPLGGPSTTAQISDEVSRSFEAALTEQRMLLRIAREGGHFDLDKSSPLGMHDTAVTPIPDIQQRAVEAQAEVAHFVAATQAIESLELDEVQRASRPATDGAFTPAPSRRPSKMHPAQPVVAPWRFDDTEPPMPQRIATPPPAPTVRARLPWIIATVATVVGAGIAIVLYLELRDIKHGAAPVAANAPVTANAPVVMMKAEPPPPPPVVEKAADPPPEVVEPTPAPPPPPTIEKTIEKTIDKPKKREEPRPKKEEPKLAKEEPKPKKEPEVAAGPPGSITIDSAPMYAVIYIDGKKVGETPLVNLKLAAGKHSVRAVSASGGTRTLSITIESGKTARPARIEW